MYDDFLILHVPEETIIILRVTLGDSLTPFCVLRNEQWAVSTNILFFFFFTATVFLVLPEMTEFIACMRA